MLSFELSAIDLILVIAVIMLLLLYWTKLSKGNEKEAVTEATVEKSLERDKTGVQRKYAECPRGFGNIKIVSDDGTVSERCLGCYRIMECYSGGNEEATVKRNIVS